MFRFVEPERALLTERLTVVIALCKRIPIGKTDPADAGTQKEFADTPADAAATRDENAGCGKKGLLFLGKSRDVPLKTGIHNRFPPSDSDETIIQDFSCPGKQLPAYISYEKN